ncbi:hypothetical protein ANSO36C_58730 [Nostoc cf. commune SO-36]|uniref:Dynamin family protein n=1 Tax=Nostoc cf. commune SO-36 TaxID=449208 RepID=A0ABM7ZA08_NOSCO|nr:GTPase [Nostoc commune]BDI20071.1 hypothetical protein ANSO36C_58730 [Nostoc cf. commune SO-36]
MLFILNRIDVFRADRNWPETENRFVEDAICKIKYELSEQLKEYTQEIDTLQVIKLSTWAALLALQIKNNDEIYSAEASKKARNNFLGLIDESILEDLPFKTERWSRHDRNRVSDALWQKSYAEEFQQSLREHISQYFPRLVIPQAIERFNIAAGNAITEWALQTTTAILNSSEEKYQDENKNILQIRSVLKDFLEYSDKKLREPFEKIKQVVEEKAGDEALRGLEETLYSFENDEPYNKIQDKLIPLYDWNDHLGQGITRVLEVVAQSLKSGKVILDTPNLKKANIIHVNLLGNCLKRLVNLGYTGFVAESGKKMEAKTDEEKSKLRQLNEELNELAMHLNLVMKDVLEQISRQEQGRIYNSVEEIFKCHILYLKEGMNEKAPNMAINFPESELSKVDKILSFQVNFQSGFAIKSGTWQEEIEVTKTRRSWHTLFIFKETYYETKYETRSSDNAEIPSVDNLFSGWRDQSKQSRGEIAQHIMRWLVEQMDCLKKNIDEFQTNVINRYQEKLDMAHREITLDFEKQKNIWQPIHCKAKDLREEFYSLAKVLKDIS